MAARPPLAARAMKITLEPAVVALDASMTSDGTLKAPVAEGPAKKQRKRSPSPTTNRRASSLSRPGRDAAERLSTGSRLRSLSPAISQRWSEVREAESGHEPASNESEDARRGTKALLELERLSTLTQPFQQHAPASVQAGGRAAPAGMSLPQMSAAGISSRLRLTQQTPAQAAGLIEPPLGGSLSAALPLGGGGAAVGGRGRGIALRVGQVGALRGPGAKSMRVGPKMAPSTLVPSRRASDMREKENATGQGGGHGTAEDRIAGRTQTWKAEVRAASLRHAEGKHDAGGDAQSHSDGGAHERGVGAERDPREAISLAESRAQGIGTSAGQPSEAAETKDPWVALERLRRDPESAEFVYMLPYRRAAGLPLNPYHLKVVPRTRVAGNPKAPFRKVYYTLSIGGVTSNRAGEEPEFTPLEEWKRECFVFEHLLAIPIFSRYKWWKPFKRWKEHVSFARFSRNRERFRRLSVLMNPVTQRTLLALRRHTADLEASCLFVDAAPGREPAGAGERGGGAGPLSLEELSAMHEARQQHFLREFKVFWREAVACVRQGCEATEAKFELDFAREGPCTRHARLLSVAVLLAAFCLSSSETFCPSVAVLLASSFLSSC